MSGIGESHSPVPDMSFLAFFLPSETQKSVDSIITTTLVFNLLKSNFFWVKYRLEKARKHVL